MKLHRQKQKPAEQTEAPRERSLTARLTAERAYTVKQEVYVAARRSNKKRSLAIVLTSMAALLIIVMAFILRNVSDKRSYNSYYSSALQDYYSGHYDSALAALRKASDINETDESIMLMVDCYEHIGNYDKALQLLRSAKGKSDVIQTRIHALEEKRAEREAASKVTVAGKQYDSSTAAFSLRDSTLGNGVLDDVVQLYSLTTLTLSNDGLTDISPLSALGGVQTLDLSNNAIADLAPLAALHELRTLYLDGNPITDFSPLYTNAKLTMLSIKGIGITDRQLKELSDALPGCVIHSENTSATASKISVGGTTFASDVTELDLSDLGLSDLSALSVCKELKKLDLSGNEISDLTPLMDLPKLEWLSIKDNLVLDLRPLMGIGTLGYLNAEGNTVSSTAALASLQNLSELYLANNPIADFSGLKTMANLRTLGLENTGLGDEALQNLYSLTNLTRLRLYENDALSGEGVDKLKRAIPGCTVGTSELIYSYEFAGEKYRSDITELSLSGRDLKDISDLSHFSKLESLDLSNNNIENIYILSFVGSHIRELNLANNAIADNTPLVSLHALTSLNLSGNKISSVTQLMQIPTLTYLDLTGNPLSEKQIEDLRTALPKCEIIFGE